MSKKSKFDHKKIDKKWQGEWFGKDFYRPDIAEAKNPFYNLFMYPYPSGEGLHAGHAFSSTGSDIYGRFMRMHGKDVFQPIGYDSFGIHSENYALKIGEHPSVMLARTTKNFERQLKSLGHGYDWTRTVTVSDKDYYQWTQWIFVQLFKAGLACRKSAEVNWCPSCKTVLADEQVIAGLCERCQSPVKRKELQQWFLRITEYADRLLNNLSKIDWPDKIKTAQTNWIGKSQGVKIEFETEGLKEKIEVFTTRPDTLFGATFLVFSPDSALAQKLTTKENKNKLSEYIKLTQNSRLQAENSRLENEVGKEKEKTGVFIGSYAVNPATKKKIPIWVSDYVLAGYGSGAIMGVPGHDQRDWDFAKKFDLEIVEVISGGDINQEVYSGEGEIVNSGNWDGLRFPADAQKISLDIENKGWGKSTIHYHLRDWLISRQRYWGPPIPLIFCEKCSREGKSYFSQNQSKLLRQGQSDWNFNGWYPVPEESLPVELPKLTDYQPKGDGKGPLARHPEFYKVACPECGSEARRETDVSDTFLDSSWYFLRYPSIGSDSSGKMPFDINITRKWLPVNLYFGGPEHAVLHLMYARFVSMFLHDWGFLAFEEPFLRFFAHGLMIKDGAKMSKSRGNVVNPDSYIEKFGADAFRLYLMFIGPMDGSPDFRDSGMEGMHKFVERIWQLYADDLEISLSEKDGQELSVKVNQTIYKVTKDIENFKYNTAISAIMILVNFLEQCRQKAANKKENTVSKSVWKSALKVLNLLLAPFAPHLAEEIWVEKLKESFSVHRVAWPEADKALLDKEKVIMVIQVNNKVRGQIALNSSLSVRQDEVEEIAKKEVGVNKWLIGKKIKKTIFIAGKLINFIVE